MDASRTSRGRAAVGWLSRGLFTVSFTGLIGYVALAATGRWTVLGELASQFRFYFGFAALGALLVFLAAGRWRTAGVAVLLALWGSWPEGGLWLMPADAGPRSAASTVAMPAGAEAGRPYSSAAAGSRLTSVFHMVSSNVLRPNTRYGEVFDAAVKSDPDVIGFLEFSPAWRDAAIARLQGDYPFHVEALNTSAWNEHSWGLMLFSKTEFVSSRVLPVDFDDWAPRPVLQATIASPLELTITLAHPERPGRPARMRARRAALEAIARSEVQGHWLVIGDLNTTSTSPLFQDLVDAAGLKDSRVGYGRLPSWSFGDRLPGPLPVPLPNWLRLSVAIDHALHSDGLCVLDRTTLYTPGSDHRAVSVTLHAPSGPSRD